MEGPAEVAVADEPDAGPAQQDRVGVAGREVALAARAEGAILAADAAREVDREPQRELGDGLGVGGAAAEDVDAGPEARLVVDVGVEVPFDVHHDPQRRGPLEPLGRQVGLTDDRERARQGGVEPGLVGGVTLQEHDLVVPVESRLRIGREDPVDPVWGRAEDDEGAVGHRPNDTRLVPTDGGALPEWGLSTVRASGIQSRAANRTQTGPETEEPPLLRAVRCPRVTGNPGALRHPPIHPMTGCPIGVFLSRARSERSLHRRPLHA